LEGAPGANGSDILQLTTLFSSGRLSLFFFDNLLCHAATMQNKLDPLVYLLRGLNYNKRKDVLHY
jgi:hypothetical protein